LLLFLAVAASVMAIQWRSYLHYDGIYWSSSGGYRVALSRQGRIMLLSQSTPSPFMISGIYFHTDYNIGDPIVGRRKTTIAGVSFGTTWEIWFPHWMLLAPLALLTFGFDALFRRHRQRQRSSE